ncbi:hypothetical protein CLV84_2845 [Neolewinella xylanilytica]|uniref:Outer membrane protein with beta-barrel domain n=1 Tax=Neolewinella xylanilytica TaxID=1514080 RepID=A0A2S6I418_9BACT|nr:hypothetical protein [Neolewinella xylanilytica]PPK85932.1 hypothetical protein CLV84_2845 [Neolewinella xylanilytica]
MLFRILTLALITASLSLPAQSNPSPRAEAPPWLFLDSRVSLAFADIRTGSEYTTAENTRSLAVRLMARKHLSPWLSAGGGLGLGNRSFRLASTYDRYLRQNFPPNTFPDEIDWFNRLEYSDLHLEVPLDIRAEVLGVGPGALYLRTGTAWLIPLHTRNENYRVYDNRPEPALMPEARLNSPITNILSTGIGFIAKDRPDYRWYLELNYDWSTSDTVRAVPPDQQDSRSRHFPDLRARQLGILFGIAL